MKRQMLLALLPVLCLASCQDQGYAGKYKFMLGKEAAPETQVGITMELTENDYSYRNFYRIITVVKDNAELEAYPKTYLNDGNVIKVRKDDKDGLTHFYQYEKATTSYIDKGTDRPYKDTTTVEGGKKFNLDASIGSSLGTLPADIAKLIYAGIAGYYKPTQFTDEKYGQRVEIGSVVSEDGIKGIEYLYDYLATEFNQATSDLVRYIFEGDETTIPPDFVDYLIASYLKSGEFTFKIPVSLEDFQHQLVWYGKYYDINPEVKEKLHSFKDVLKNLKDVVTGLKIFDLTKMRYIALDSDNNKYVWGDTIKMPGVQGEGRIGTLPNKEVDKTIGMNEIDVMNKNYASAFSYTYTYQDSTSKAITGRISKMKKEGEDRDYYYFYDANDTWTITPDTTSINATVYCQSAFDYDNPKDVRIEFMDNALDPTLGVKINYVVDLSTNTKLDPATFYQTPFTFRSPNTLPLVLSKK